MLHDPDQLQKDLDLSLDHREGVGHFVERGDSGFVVQTFDAIWAKAYMEVLTGGGACVDRYLEPKSQGCSPARDTLKSHLPRIFNLPAHLMFREGFMLPSEGRETRTIKIHECTIFQPHCDTDDLTV